MADLNHDVPVRLTEVPGTQSPAGDLVATFYWVTRQGEIVKDLGRVPVTGGVAAYRGAAPPDPELRFAITIVESTSGGPVYRSGPLSRLPGPPPRTNSTRVSIVHFPRIAFGLGPDSDGLGILLIRHLEQAVGSPLRFVGAELTTDGEGRYVVNVRGRLQRATLFSPFIYGRALRLRGSDEPGRPVPCVRADIEGDAVVRGRLARAQREALDSAIVAGAELQLHAAVKHIAAIQNGPFGTGFTPQTYSVSRIAVSGVPGREPDAGLNISWAAVTGGVFAPPGDGVLDPD